MWPRIFLRPFDGFSFKNRNVEQGVNPIRREKMALSKELLEILACPKCKGDITLNRKGDGLICRTCRLVYPIKDDIPVMLIDEALPYQEE
jgi:uncharacterized protein YbaR (Trm112 family)